MILHHSDAWLAYLKSVGYFRVGKSQHSLQLSPRIFPAIWFPSPELWLLGCVAGSEEVGWCVWITALLCFLAKLQNNVVVVKLNGISTHLWHAPSVHSTVVALQASIWLHLKEVLLLPFRSLPTKGRQKQPTESSPADFRLRQLHDLTLSLAWGFAHFKDSVMSVEQMNEWMNILTGTGLLQLFLTSTFALYFCLMVSS